MTGRIVRQLTFVVGCLLAAAVVATAAKPDADVPHSLVHAHVACTRPVRVAILQDKSKSTPSRGVYQLLPQELEPLRDLILECGGELGVQDVGMHSHPLQRWFVPAPAARPIPPSGRDTSINAAIKRAEYQSQLRTYERQNKDRMDAASALFKTFFARVTAILSRDVVDNHTPLWTAISRADAFLGEPDHGAASGRYLVIVSDGLDEGGRPTPLTSGASIFFCNGHDVGSLQGLTMTVFEQPASAFRQIVATENHHD